MRVIAIDPGNTKSAYCIIDADTLRPLAFGILKNEELRKEIRAMKFEEDDRTAIEMMQSYGNLIGKDVLDTVFWIGRFYEVFRRKTYAKPQLIYRMEEKMHICHDSKAGDPNIRRALIDRFAKHDFKCGRGTLKNPDWFHGFKDDIWAAYAIGLTFIETKYIKIERSKENE
ncbi:MAG: hypothetical protein K0R50_429 [Eubacterium sp.]|jgi:hypothetical protein|nr:hypothetical protein [Eubacterium sp.]